MLGLLCEAMSFRCVVHFQFKEFIKTCIVFSCNVLCWVDWFFIMFFVGLIGSLSLKENKDTLHHLMAVNAKYHKHCRIDNSIPT